MHSTRPLTRLVLVLALGLSGAAGAESAPEAGTGVAAKPGGIKAAAAAAAQASPQTPAEPDQAQIDAWLAAARALKAERPELFGGAEGVLAYLVLPDGQGATAGIEPGDVLIGYGDTRLNWADQLVALGGETSPEETLTLGWLRPAAGGGAAVLEARIRGGRIGVGIRDLAESPVARMQALLDGGTAAWQSSRHEEAMGLFQQGLALARSARARGAQAVFLNHVGVMLSEIRRDADALEQLSQVLTIYRDSGNRNDEGHVLNSVGTVYRNLARFSEALDHYMRALAIHREIGDRRGEGNALAGLANVYADLGRHPEALEHYSGALGIAREIGDALGEAANLNNLGLLYYHLSRYTEARDHYTQAVGIYHAIGDRNQESSTLNALGAVYQSLGRHIEASEHHLRALTIYREIADRQGESGALGNLGNSYAQLGRYAEALESYTQSLVIDRALGDRQGVGAGLTGLGNVYQEMGHYDKALSIYTERLALARELANRKGEAAALGNLGVLYESIGNYGLALEHHQQSLAIHQEISDRIGEAKDLGNLGNAYLWLGLYPQALEHHGKALVIHREMHDRRSEGTDLNNLGLVYKDLGRFPDAREHYDGALTISQEIGDRKGEGNALGNLGVISWNLNETSDAVREYTQALSIRREIGDRRGESVDLLNLGLLHQSESRIAEALAHYHTALAVQAELSTPETLWRLWDNLRLLSERDAQPAPAILAGKRAVNTIQAMRAILAAPPGNTSLTREQQQFMQDKEDVYRDLADLLIAQGRHAEAQQVLDMLKEQELYDYIKEEGAHDPRQTRVGLNAMEAEWSQAYDAAAAPASALAQRLAELSRIKPEARTEAEKAEIDRLTAERDALSAELQRQLAALPERFAAIDPARQAAEDQRFADAPDTKRALLAALSKRSRTRTGLLQFVLLKDKVRVLLTTPDGWHPAIAQVPKDTLATEIETLRTSLTDPTQDAKTPAQALYHRLVAPLAEEIDAAKLESLLVHLDGRLRYVPFAALHDGNQWLAERWPIIYYTAASERKDELRGGDWQVAGLGVSEGRQGFDPLPTVAGEIDGIVREGDGDARGVLPGHALLNAAFSEGALRLQAGDSANRILHIASHFLLRPGNDAQSSLLLGTVAADGKPDTLSLKALRETKPLLDLRHLDLVTLSACETAMGGADDTGAEIEGMGAVIQRQGARGVLASLWSVEDASTGPLMQTFYRRRAERPELTKAQALRLAQLDLLRGTLDGAPPPQGCATAPSGGRPGPDPGQNPSENRGERSPLDLGSKGGPRPALDRACRWSHPYYWAPFILMGNWL